MVVHNQSNALIYAVGGKSKTCGHPISSWRNVVFSGDGQTALGICRLCQARVQTTAEMYMFHAPRG